MKYIIFLTFIFASQNTLAAPPQWVLESFVKLSASDGDVRQKSAYRLKGYYTDNGQAPTQKDINLLKNNIDNLLNALSDKNQEVRYYTTELLGGRKMDQYPSPPLTFLSLLRDKEYNLFKGAIFKNIDDKYENLSESSIKAMINMKECSLLPKMKSRISEMTSEYRKKYSLKSLERFRVACNQ